MLLILNYHIVFITKISGHLRNNYIGNPIKLDCDDLCTTINIVNSKKKEARNLALKPNYMRWIFKSIMCKIQINSQISV